MACANAIDNMENTELNLDELCDLLDEDEKEDTNETDNNVASLQDKDKSAVIPTEIRGIALYKFSDFLGNVFKQD